MEALSASRTPTETLNLPQGSILSFFPNHLQEHIQETIERIESLDQERVVLSPEKKQEIEKIAQAIADGDVVVVSFGPVVGYVCDGENAGAKAQINRFKGMESHLFALITTPELFPQFIDADHVPKDFYRKAKEGTLPQAFHYRVATKSPVADCYSEEEYEGKKLPIIQMALFGNAASPEIAYLISVLHEKHAIDYVIATSANQHGQSEVDIYKQGRQLAQKNALMFLDVAPDLDVIAGSYAGIHVHYEDNEAALEDALHIFRHGHFDADHIRMAFQFQTMKVAENIPRPRFNYAELGTDLDPEVIEKIMSLPARLWLPVLHAYVQAIKKNGTLAK